MKALILAILFTAGCAKASSLECPDKGKVEKVKSSEGWEVHCVRWDGLKHGPFQITRPDGSLYMKGSYREDLMDGVMTTYRGSEVYNQSVWRRDSLVRWTIRDGQPVGR